MATTIARIQSTPGVASSRLYLGSFSSTGTANPAGYLNTGELWGNYGFQITEALAGWFIYGIFNSSLQQLAGGMIYLEDDTRVYFGFDPPSSVWSTWNNLDVATSTRASPADVTTQLTAQGLTSTRAGFLDRLDATISSRESDASASTRATTNQSEHDATQATLAALNVSSQVQTAMTSQGYTTARAPLLDRLDATITSREAETAAATRATTNQTEHDATQSSIAALNIGAAVTAALTAQGLTTTRAGNLDRLDATISSRESETSASTRATANQTEHDATQTTLAGLSVSVDEAAIAAAVWNALTAASATSGSFGQLVKDFLNVAVSSRAVASDVTAGLTSQGYTTARAATLDNLNATVGSRATPADIPTQLNAQGLTTLRAARLDNLDAAVSTTATPAQVTTQLTAQGLTTARANLLDRLDATVSSRATPGQVTTALTDQGLTSARAGKIDNLDNLTAAPPTVAAIADAVLDEALSGHMTAGTAGEAIKLARDQALIAATNTQP
jgi:hypothetical protein